MKSRLVNKMTAAVTAASCIGAGVSAFGQAFDASDLIVSRSVYDGNSSTITVGQALPGGGNAVADGSFANVWNNATVDSSFGVASPIYFDVMTQSGSVVNTISVDPTHMLTSFSSKSELGLNLSTDGSAITFMGYTGASVNALDVSNSNTPGHNDPTNPDAQTFQRVVGQLNSDGTISYTPVNAYSGNNGRASILVNNANGTGQNFYYMVGNAGNGSGTEPANIVNNTGVQMTTPGGSADTTVVGAQQGTSGASTGFQYGFSVTQAGATADKSGKDDNFRGITIYGNTMFVTKGSGNNGIDTVYQVGSAGTLPTPGTAASTTFTILPGFPTSLANSKTVAAQHPFGLWFANATTLYVADEGDGTLADAGTTKDPTAGLGKWSLVGGTWHLDYTLNLGLQLGVAYTVPGYSGPVETDGLRGLVGEVNGDGTVTLFATTSTASNSGDAGADPNELVKITDMLSDSTAAQASGEQFTTVETAYAGEVFRGVSFAPVPEPSALAIAGLMALYGCLARSRKKS